MDYAAIIPIDRYGVLSSRIVIYKISSFKLQNVRLFATTSPTIYVDGGISSEVMYEHCFRNLGAKTKAKLKESRNPLVGFSGENVGGWKKHEDQPWKGGSPSSEYKHLNPEEQPTRAGKKAEGRRAKWGNQATETEEAFQAMKKLIAELPTLTALKKEEELMVYVLAANEAVSVVLLVEREGRQAPIHYVSRTLQGAEINYPQMEKLALVLVHAARRLRRYFQGHTIKVITDKPISQILDNREATGRLAKWGVEL
ncbi:reverse transcriptase domain-containing protein [Tanacetum coccineum]